MPTPASGVAKSVRYKEETTFGTAAGTSGGQVIRNVTSGLALSKDTYSSNEKRTDYQVADFRHGVRRVRGAIAGELSAGTYKDFIAASLRRAFTAVTAMTTLSLTIAGSGPYTIARASGSYLTDGVKIGHVLRITAGSVNASNLSKNLLVTAVTALSITVIVLNASTMVAEGPIASCTITVIGKQTYIPTTGHTDKSYSIEHWFSDLAQSELFTGCKVGGIDIGLPPTGMATIGIDFQGKDITTATSVYYTSPTAATATGIDAAVNGVLLVGGSQVATVTGLSLKIENNLSGDPVVGANTVPNLFQGRVVVTGEFSVYFDSATLRDAFVNETATSLVVALTADNTATSDFVTFVLPNIKLGSADKDDGEKGIVQRHSFQALYNSTGGTGVSSEQTTLLVQDSQA